jgi:hypothetical protein
LYITSSIENNGNVLPENYKCPVFSPHLQSEAYVPSGVLLSVAQECLVNHGGSIGEGLPYSTSTFVFIHQTSLHCRKNQGQLHLKFHARLSTLVIQNSNVCSVVACVVILNYYYGKDQEVGAVNACWRYA